MKARKPSMCMIYDGEESTIDTARDTTAKIRVTAAGSYTPSRNTETVVVPTEVYTPTLLFTGTPERRKRPSTTGEFNVRYN